MPATATALTNWNEYEWNPETGIATFSNEDLLDFQVVSLPQPLNVPAPSLHDYWLDAARLFRLEFEERATSDPLNSGRAST